jgi:hypothetical protein
MVHTQPLGLAGNTYYDVHASLLVIYTLIDVV